MHDLHVANKVFNLVLENAAKNGLTRVVFIKIKLGEIVEHGADISAENLAFNLQTLGRGTIIDSAEIVVEKVVGDSWELVEIRGE